MEETGTDICLNLSLLSYYPQKTGRIPGKILRGALIVSMIRQLSELAAGLIIKFLPTNIRGYVSNNLEIIDYFYMY